MKSIIAAATIIAALTTGAAAVELPAICTTGDMEHAGMSHGGMSTEPMAMQPMDQAHQDLMAGMAAMNSQMDQAMMAPDIDVAFICGMIPHHQGAIDMARAELAHGDDPFAREMAEKVIAAQEAEIAQMLEWLVKQPQP